MITYQTITQNGGRPVNEDRVAVSDGGDALLFALADGLGGHGMGDIAAEIAVKKSIEVFERDNKAVGLLEACFNEGQAEVLNVQRHTARFNEMKTTLVLLNINSNTARWCHIGDSRIYLFRKKKLFMRSYDHSVPQMLVATGEINERDIRHHEDRNRLLRVIGTEWDNPRYELGQSVTLKKGDAFLLCSDGFWEWIEEKAMAGTLKGSKNPKQWLDSMESEILANAGKKKSEMNMDNYSAIAAFVEGI